MHHCPYLPHTLITVTVTMTMTIIGTLGTGWSTNIPPYSPVALAEHVIARVRY